MPKYKNEVNIQNVIAGIVASTIFLLVGVVGYAEVQQKNNPIDGL